jgi:pimeloyl-ACP methyl ester carboxylesterase
VASWAFVERGGLRLAYRDFGGQGSPVLLLHGLAGHADEWADTASWLTERHRVVALEARGHGHSERAPRDVSPEAHVADTALVIERVAQGPVPFASREAALEFFTGKYGGSLAAEAWTEGLEHRDGSWWPRFDVEVMERTLREAVGRAYWEEWDRIRCPTLVVRAGNGFVDPGDARAMERRLSEARMVELEGAAHDLHLDRPLQWREVLDGFLASLPPAPGRP